MMILLPTSFFAMKSTVLINVRFHKTLFDAIYHSLKDPNKSNTQKYFPHSNVKRYELALLRSGYFFYFSLLYKIFYIVLSLSPLF